MSVIQRTVSIAHGEEQVSLGWFGDDSRSVGSRGSLFLESAEKLDDGRREHFDLGFEAVVVQVAVEGL